MTPRPWPPPDPSVRDGEHRLRLLGPDDAERFLLALKDPTIMHFGYHDRFDFDETTFGEFIDLFDQRARAGEGVLLAVSDDEDPLVAQTMLFGANWTEATVEVGFWVSPWARGRGVAPRAIRLTCNYAFAHGMERIQGLTSVDNVAAQRAMEAAGFTREGTLRGLEKIQGGGRLDQVSYSLLHTD